MNKCLELRTRSVLFSLAEIFGALESVNLFPQEIEPSRKAAANTKTRLHKQVHRALQNMVFENVSHNRRLGWAASPLFAQLAATKAWSFCPLENDMARKILLALLLFVFLYLGAGFLFHLKWQSDLAACREMRRAQGEFVEPEVFGGFMGLIFDVTNWPIYAWANIYHYGTPFAIPCTHSRVVSLSYGGAFRYVEGFGKPFQNVSLQSWNASQVEERQCSEPVLSSLGIISQRG
jgi:hypothetical protein